MSEEHGKKVKKFRHVERSLYKLSDYLRKFPPIHDYHFISNKQLRKMYTITFDQAYEVLCKYRSRSISRFIEIYGVIPDEGKPRSKEWEQALEVLNKEGLYLLETMGYMSNQWGQISYRQKEHSTIRKARSVDKRLRSLLKEVEDLKLEDAQRMLNPEVFDKQLLLPVADEIEEEVKIKLEEEREEKLEEERKILEKEKRKIEREKKKKKLEKEKKKN